MRFDVEVQIEHWHKFEVEAENRAAAIEQVKQGLHDGRYVCSVATEVDRDVEYSVVPTRIEVQHGA